MAFEADSWGQGSRSAPRDNRNDYGGPDQHDRGGYARGPSHGGPGGRDERDVPRGRPSNDVRAGSGYGGGGGYERDSRDRDDGYGRDRYGGGGPDRGGPPMRGGDREERGGRGGPGGYEGGRGGGPAGSGNTMGDHRSYPGGPRHEADGRAPRNISNDYNGVPMRRDDGGGRGNFGGPSSDRGGSFGGGPRGSSGSSFSPSKDDFGRGGDRDMRGPPGAGRQDDRDMHMRGGRPDGREMRGHPDDRDMRPPRPDDRMNGGGGNFRGNQDGGRGGNFGGASERGGGASAFGGRSSRNESDFGKPPSFGGNDSSFGGRPSNSSSFGSKAPDSGFGGGASSGFGAGGGSDFGGRGSSQSGGGTGFGSSNITFGSQPANESTGFGFGGKSDGYGSRGGGFSSDRGRGGGFSGGGGGGGGRACYNCNQEGHISSACPEPRSGNGGGGGGGRRGGCFNCGQEGHRANECSEPRNGGGGGHRGGRSDFNNAGGFDNGNASSFEGDFGNLSFARGGAVGGMRSDYDPTKRAPRDWKPEVVDAETLFEKDREAATLYDPDYDAPVTVTGTGINDTPITSWENSPLNPQLVKVLIDKCNFTIPRPIQAAAVPQVLAGRDLIGHTSTGGGKTLAFVLPIIDKILSVPEADRNASTYDPYAMVIAPSRELATQIQENFYKFGEELGLKSVLCIGELSRAENGQQMKRCAHIAVGTPGRLMDLIEAGEISLTSLMFLVIDEADQLLSSRECAHLQAILKNRSMVKNQPKRQTLLFSATIPDQFKKLTQSILNRNHVVVSNGNSQRATKRVKQIYVETRGMRGKNVALSEIFAKDDPNAPMKTLIFVKTKKQSDFLALELSQDGIPAEGLNGDRPQDIRSAMYKRFNDGEFSVLVGTDLCSRGLDVYMLDRVINFDLPEAKIGSTEQAIDTFVHRIGRCGRKREGYAYTFLDPDNDADIDLSKALIKVCQEVDQTPPDFMIEMSQQTTTMGGGAFDFGGSGGGAAFGSGGFGNSTSDAAFGSAGFGNGGGFDSAPTSGFGSGGFGGASADAAPAFGSSGFGESNGVTAEKAEPNTNGFSSGGFGNDKPAEQAAAPTAAFGSSGFGTAEPAQSAETSEADDQNDGGGEW